VNPSILDRFKFSFLANVFRSVSVIVAGMLLARSLGPQEYGTMMFLLGTLIALQQLTDLGSSTAFFTFIGQQQRSKKFVRFYVLWLITQFSIPFILIWLIFPDEVIKLVWSGEKRSLVLLAFTANYFQSTMWTAMAQMGESQRLTRAVQGVSLLVSVCHVCLISLFWFYDALSITSVFILLTLEWFLAISFMGSLLSFPKSSHCDDDIRSIFKEFYSYCAPLILYTFLSFVYQFSDRWLLQEFSGSVDQAYYAVGYQFSAIALLATQSVLNIFWKEISEFNFNNNKDALIKLYRQVSRSMYFISASACFFVMPWAEDILQLVLGEEYVNGYLVLCIMLVYPLHQSLGQIVTTMMYATERVKAHVTIGGMFLAVSIFVSYFILAPEDSFVPGYELGSLGLAGKMVVMQFLTINTISFYLAYSLEISFDWRYQIASVIICAAAGWISFEVTHLIFDSSTSIFIRFAFSSLAYLIFIVTSLVFKPSLVGITRSDINQFISK
jgi:O-antigen/teichoic acid export membrane protein|tara:strand:+ start:864 stop:2357 length:1494 start_codon:yes stop_codon:yes gene_type:complete